MTVWLRVGYRDVNIGRRLGEQARDKIAKTCHHRDRNQSSSAFTDLGDKRKLRRLRLTLLR